MKINHLGKKKIENQLSSKKDSVYKILEKPKKIEDIIENELSNSTKINKFSRNVMLFSSLINSLHSKIKIKALNKTKKF